MAEEKQYENKIKKFLDDLPNTWYYKHFSAMYGKNGVPDIIACINGTFVGIEVKASNGKPSKLQEINVEKINQSGGYAVITYPKDFENLKKELRMISYDND